MFTIAIVFMKHILWKTIGIDTKGFKTRMDKHISDCRNNNSISKLPIYVYNYHI